MLMVRPKSQLTKPNKLKEISQGSEHGALGYNIIAQSVLSCLNNILGYIDKLDSVNLELI